MKEVGSKKEELGIQKRFLGYARNDNRCAVFMSQGEKIKVVIAKAQIIHNSYTNLCMGQFRFWVWL